MFMGYDSGTPLVTGRVLLGRTADRYGSVPEVPWRRGGAPGGGGAGCSGRRRAQMVAAVTKGNKAPANFNKLRRQFSKIPLREGTRQVLKTGLNSEGLDRAQAHGMMTGYGRTAGLVPSLGS